MDRSEDGTMKNPFASTLGLGLILVGFALSACSVILEAKGEQCSTDADCHAAGLANATCQASMCVERSEADAATDATTDAAADVAPDAPLDPKWGCVGDIKWTAADSTQPITYPMRMLRLFGETPLKNLEVRSCAMLDLDCASPFSTAVSDERGVAVMELFKGFDGYLLIEPTEEFPDLVPAISPLLPPPAEGRALPDNITELEPMHLVSLNEATPVALILKTELDPELGHIFGLAFDCEGKPTAGVSLTIDTLSPKTVQYYVNNNLPSSTLGETTSTGEAGFINVPPGLITVTATSVDVGRTARVTVLVRAGHIVYLGLSPSP